MVPCKDRGNYNVPKEIAEKIKEYLLSVFMGEDKENLSEIVENKLRMNEKLKQISNKE